jgi:hypothetical protein
MMHLDDLPNQITGESTELFLRRHWVELLVIAFYFFILITVPILLLTLLAVSGADIFQSPFFGPMASSFLSLYLLIVFIIIMTQFTDYYLDTWIVTTERIINIEQFGLFSRVVSELHLNEIQDVTAETHGVIATVFTYGDVYIQSAGKKERFNFKNIDNPEHVKEMIQKLTHASKVRSGDLSV